MIWRYLVGIMLFWLAPCLLSAQPTNLVVSFGNHDKSEPSIAVRSNQPLHQIAVWNDFEQGWSKAGWAITTDGWATKTSGIRDPISFGGQNWVYGFDPSSVVTESGEIYYCYVSKFSILSSDARAAVVLSKTVNNGVAWTSSQVSAGLSHADKSFIVRDAQSGRLCVSWTHIGPPSNRILFRSSSNGGVSFEPVGADVLVHDYGYIGGGGGYPSADPQTDEGLARTSIPLIGKNGSIHVFYLDPTPGSGIDYLYVKSTMNPNEFPFEPTTVSTLVNQRTLWGNIEIYPLPSVAADPNVGLGYLYAVFATPSAENLTDWKIKFARSTSNGASWETPKIICDLNPGIQYFPWITVDPTGLITISFLHSELPADVSLFTIQSRDNGASFLAANRITTVSSNPANALYTHHYMGMASSATRTTPAWTDYRNNKAQIFTANVDHRPSSQNADATGYGQSSKIVHHAGSNSIHMIYRKNGTELWYGKSSDDGGTWPLQVKISGSIAVTTDGNPSLDLDAAGNPHVVWGQAGAGIYYVKNTGSGWGAPYFIRSDQYNKIAPSFKIQTGSNTGHVAWVSRTWSGGPTGPQMLVPEPGAYSYHLRHGTFSLTSGSPTLTSTNVYTSTTPLMTAPAITLDGSTVHIAWEWAGDIFHTQKNGGTWQAPLNLSNLTIEEEKAGFPTIKNQMGNLFVAWQEEDNTYGEPQKMHRISYREKVNGVWSSKIWTSPQSIGNDLIDATHPFINGPYNGYPLVMWNQQRLASNGTYSPQRNPTLWFSYPPNGGPGPKPLSVQHYATASSSKYPNFTSRYLSPSVTRLYTIWTEGKQSPFQVSFSWDDLSTGTPQAGIQKPPTEIEQPAQFVLHGNYPNPFNSSTNIRYELPEYGEVSLRIYNLVGELIATVVSGTQSPGSKQLTFNGSSIPSGVYFVRLQFGTMISTKKMVHLK